jgi:hypothetical protein
MQKTTKRTGRPPKEPLKIPTWAQRQIAKLSRESRYGEQQILDDALLQGLPECELLYSAVIKFRKNAIEARKDIDQDDEQIQTVETRAENRPVGAFDNFPEPAPEEEAGTLAGLEPVEVGSGQLAESETHLGNSDGPSADDEGFPV